MITPQSYADARLVLGEQRSGKNGYAAATVKDDYWRNLNGIMIPNNSGQIIKAESLKKDDWQYLRVPYHPFKYVKVFSEDMKQSKIIKLPTGYLPLSPIKVFANFHLFGLKAAYLGIEDVIENIDNDLFTNAYVLSDESSWLDRRFNMTVEGKEMAKFTATIGKRNLHFIQLVQYSDQIETRYVKFTTTRVYCTYNKETKEVAIEIKEKGKPDKKTSFYLPYYWFNYDTSERVPTGQYNIDRAMKKFRVMA